MIKTTPVNESIRILLVEDMPSDVELAQREINRALKAWTLKRVETRDAFLSALQVFQPDLIISDYKMPNFDGLSALKLALEHAPLTPVIILTGAINEETAVQCMKAGATDYVIKEHIMRLGQAVIHALEEKEVRRERLRAQAALQENQARLSGIIASAMDAIISIDSDQRILVFNAAAERTFGYPAAEMIGQRIEHLLAKRYRAAHEEHIRRFGKTGVTNRSMSTLGTLYGLRADGVEFPIEASISQVHSAEQKLYTVILRDITERKKHERELEAVAQIAMALRSASTRDDMLAVIVRRVCSLLRAKGAALSLCEPGTSETTVASGYGVWADQVGMRFPAAEGVAGFIVLTGQPYLSNDALHDSRIIQREHIGNLCAIAGAPLIAREQIIGALWIGRETSIAADELHVLTAVSDIAANALQRARIVETLEQQVAERTRKLVQANKRLTELDRLKSKFVADVSHELRTPVANLRLYVDLLAHKDPEKFDQYLAVLREQIARQRQLVENILSLSRLELGANKATFAPLDLNALISQIIAAHRAAAEVAGLTLNFHPTPNLPPVKGENNQLGQVITNLIANGISYTPAGQIEVDTDLKEQYVVMAVRDTGMGIEPEDLPHLFDRFYRGSQTRHIGGTGLGLAIVKEIIELHHGKIEAQSKVGVGSTFQVYLPVANYTEFGASGFVS